MNLSFQKPDKKSFCYLAIILAAAILVIAGCFWYYRSLRIEPGIGEEALEKLKQERIIKQQLEELERLREATSPLTEEEIQSQLRELEKLRQETESLSERETQTQLEELEKLRSQ